MSGASSTAADLPGSVTPSASTTSPPSWPGRGRTCTLDLADSAIRGRHSTVPVLDPRARAEFRRRITDRDEDLTEAQAHHDLGRVERLESEREALLDELRRAAGHAGKDRGLGPSTVERARKAVTARLRDTIGRIEAVLPELGSHLDRSIITGTYCRYQPTEPLTWDLQVRPKP